VALQGRFGIPFWDALVAAAARSAGCEYLLSEGFQNHQDLAGLIVFNPFEQTPESLLG
jgi:predicted nucleic acid-binding protein